MRLRTIQNLFLLLLGTARRNNRCEVDKSLRRLKKILKNEVVTFVYLKQCCVHEIEHLKGISANGQEELRRAKMPKWKYEAIYCRHKFEAQRKN